MANALPKTAAQIRDLAPVQTVAGRGDDVVLGITDITGLPAALSDTAAAEHTHEIADIVDLADELAAKADTADLATKADLVGGVIPSNQIPALAISTYLGAAANQAAMLTKNGQVGDWCNRTDTGTAWILAANDYTLVGSWVELNYPSAPVTSVNGQTGAPVLTADDVDAQPVDATLTAIAGLTSSADKIIYATGADTFALTDFTALARTLAAHTATSSIRSTLGLEIGVNVLAPDGDGSGLSGLTASQFGDLGTMADQDADDVAITGGSIAGIADLAIADGGTGASTASDARANLELGSMSTQSANAVVITGGTITGLGTPSASSDAATKGYIDGLISSPMSFKNAINCSTNPNYPAATQGDVYVVSVAGKIGGASGTSVAIGDVCLCTTTNVGGTQASVGASWAIIEHNLVGALLAANNLSDIASPSTALTNLGGQPLNALLTALAAVGSGVVANRLLYTTGTNVWSSSGITADGRTFLASANFAAMRTALGVAIGSHVQAYDADLAAIAALTTTTYGRSVLTTADAAALRTLCGLGTMATQGAGAVTITGGTITGMGTPSASSDVATKGYVDGLIASPMSFKSATDCSANPNYPAASKGDVYVVSVAGKIGGASGITVEVGDLYLATVTNAGGTQASVGTSWTLIEHNLQGALLAANNLSDVASTSTALTNLGGQPLDADLTAIAGLTPTNDDVLQRKGGAWVNRTIAQLLTDLNVSGAYQPVDADLTAIAALTTTSYGRSVLELADAAALRTLGGLGTMSTQAASSVTITGGTITGLGTPSANSDAATKGYVDGLISSPMNFKSATDCSANPNYPSAIKGDTYVVSVAGKIGGASGTVVEVGDLYLAIANNAGGTQASVGTNWILIEHNLQGALLSANNLSDIANAGTARTNLGLAIGSDVQAYSAQLASVASLSFNGLIARNGTNTVVNRSVAGTTGLIVVTDGDGVSGNPTITVGSNVLQTNVSQTISNQKTFTNNSLTDGATINWDVATAQNTKVTLGGNRTIAAPTNLVANGFYSLMIQQDGSGSKTVTWNSIFKWGDAGTPVLSTGANKRDLFTFYYDGTDLIGVQGVKGA